MLESFATAWLALRSALLCYPAQAVSSSEAASMVQKCHLNSFIFISLCN